VDRTQCNALPYLRLSARKTNTCRNGIHTARLETCDMPCAKHVPQTLLNNNTLIQLAQAPAPAPGTRCSRAFRIAFVAHAPRALGPQTVLCCANICDAPSAFGQNFIGKHSPALGESLRRLHQKLPRRAFSFLGRRDRQQAEVLRVSQNALRRVSQNTLRFPHSF